MRYYFMGFPLSEIPMDCDRVGEVAFPWSEQDLLTLMLGTYDYLIGIDSTHGQTITCLNREALFKCMLEEIQNNKKRMECLADTVSDAICMVNERQDVVLWNSEAEQLYELPRQAILNTPLQQHFSNIMLSRVLQQHKDVQATYHQPKPGIHVLINAKAVENSGKLLGAVSAERNITDLVHLNQELSEASLREEELKKVVVGSGEHRDLNQLKEEAERQFIINTLAKCDGNKVQAAKVLGIPRSTLYYKLKTLQIK